MFSSKTKVLFLAVITVTVLPVAEAFRTEIGHAAQVDEVQVTPHLSYQDRVALARNLMESTKKEALDDPNSDTRLHGFTRHYVRIDPVWTAEFILNHPVPNNGVLYDNDAIRLLMTQANKLTDEQILRLLEVQHFAVVFEYMNLLLENLPADRSNVKSKLKDLVDRLNIQPFQGISGFLAKQKLANLLNDQDLLRQADQELIAFYESGEAKKFLNRILEDPNTDKNYSAMLRALIVQNAPESCRNDFVDAPDRPLWSILQDESLSDDKKLLELRQLEQLDVGKHPHEYLSVASGLGRVAVLDADLALSWLEQIPDEGGRVWARLHIAAVVAKHDLEKARKMVLDAYQVLSQLDQSEDADRNYNYPPALIGAVGLRLVAEVDPSLLESLIKNIVETSKPMLDSRLADSSANYFEVVASIARYDQATARKMFDEVADEVTLHASASFFTALAALSPEQVWKEFQEIPTKPDSRGITFQPRIRNALIPALCADSDNGFWDALANVTHLRIDPAILEVQP